jgi:hypothetical protein
MDVSNLHFGLSGGEIPEKRDCEFDYIDIYIPFPVLFLYDTMY